MSLLRHLLPPERAAHDPSPFDFDAELEALVRLAAAQGQEREAEEGPEMYPGARETAGRLFAGQALPVGNYS